MKTQKNILIAFILNLSFAVFEFAGGILTGSIAIMSDAIHDIGDAASIGASCFLENKSSRQPDEKYTYGYARFSVLGSLINTLILLTGSGVVIYNAIARLFFPTDVDHSGMIIFAVIGIAVNLTAAVITHKGESLNQKAVNLHMLEDVLGWVVVLIGAVIMKFTDITLIDPLMSIGVSVFILIHAVKNGKKILDLFLEKIPDGIDINDLYHHICNIDGVIDVHHIHIRSIDGQRNYATMHVVTSSNPHEVKEKIRKELKEHGICHSTLELETEGEICHEQLCFTENNIYSIHKHHHH